MIQEIEKKTESILKEHGLYQAPVHVEQIIESLDIKLSYAPSNTFSGMLVRKSDDIVLMGLNSDESFNRQRFTMAHELGHYYLHTKKNVFVDSEVTIDFRKSTSSHEEKEIQANSFAASLLMPKNLVESDFKKIVAEKNTFIEEHLVALANKYAVSKEAMKYRLINLNLIKI